MFLRLHNLPHEAHEETIREFFFGIDIPMNSIKIYYVGLNKEASVWFQTEQDLLAAFMLDGKSFCGQRLKLLLSTEDPSDPSSIRPTPSRLNRDQTLDSDSGHSNVSYGGREQLVDKRKYEDSEPYDTSRNKLSRFDVTEQSRSSDILELDRNREVYDRYGISSDRSPERKQQSRSYIDFEVSDTYQDTEHGKYGEADCDFTNFGTKKERTTQMSMGVNPIRRDRDVREHQTESLLDSIEYTQDPQAYMAELSRLSTVAGKSRVNENDFQRPTKPKPLLSSFSSDVYGSGTGRRINPLTVSAHMPQAASPKVASLLDLSVKPVPMKQQPFMSLFPNFLNGPRFYLEISDLPPKTTASEVWSWVDGARGKSEGVILGHVPGNHALSVYSRAFIVCDNMKDLQEMRLSIPIPPAFTTQSVPSDVNSYLQQLDAGCQIWVTNPLTKKDTQLSLEERVQLYFKKSNLPVIGHSDERVLARDRSDNPFPKQPANYPSAAASRPILASPHESPIGITSNRIKPLKQRTIMSLFPSVDSGCTMYLEIAELPSNTTASQVWSWVDGVRGMSDGAIFCNVPPNHSLFTSSRAFIIFENKSDLKIARSKIPLSPDQVSMCTPEDVNLYLQQLDRKCQVWITNPVEGKDSRLSAREMEEVLMKAELSALKNAPGLLGERPNMPPASQTPVRLPLQVFPIKVKSLLDMNVKPVVMKTQPFMSLFPSCLKGNRTYMEVTKLPPNTTASEVWSWVKGVRGKSEGVIFARIPQNHTLVYSRAFIVYEYKAHLIKDVPEVPARTAQCSTEAVDDFLRSLDMSCQIFVTNPSMRKDTLLTVKERLELHLGTH